MFKFTWVKQFFKNKLFHENQQKTVTVRSAKFDNLRMKVRIFSKFKQDWDGENAKPIRTFVINNTKHFIDLMELNDVPIPSIFAAGDGEIGFRWNDGVLRASACFLDDGSIVGYCSSYRDLTTKLDVMYSIKNENPEVIQLLDVIKMHFVD